MAAGPAAHRCRLRPRGPALRHQLQHRQGHQHPHGRLLLRLSDLVLERSARNAELEESTAAVRAEVGALARRDAGTSRDEAARLGALEKAAGTTEVAGRGLTITLNDAPPDARAAPGYPEPRADDLVIHQQDLRPW